MIPFKSLQHLFFPSSWWSMPKCLNNTNHIDQSICHWVWGLIKMLKKNNEEMDIKIMRKPHLDDVKYLHINGCRIRRRLAKRLQQQRLMTVIAEQRLTHYSCHPSVPNEAACILHPSYILTASIAVHTHTHTPSTNVVRSNTSTPSCTLTSVRGQWDGFFF